MTGAFFGTTYNLILCSSTIALGGVNQLVAGCDMACEVDELDL